MENILTSRKIRIVRDANQFVEEVNQSEKEQTICCTGSLYLCGDLLNAIQWKEEEENCRVC